MADSWQMIDDDGITMDWDNPDLGHLWHYLEAMRRAVMERFKASYLYYTKYFSSSSYRPYSRFCQLYSAYSTLSTSVNRLTNIYYIQLNIDKILFGEDISGTRALYKAFSDIDNPIGSTCLNRFNVSSLLQNIQDNEIISPGIISHVILWLKQRYKMINALRHVCFDLTSETKIKYAAEDGWAATIAKYNAIPWEYYGIGYDMYISVDPSGNSIYQRKLDSIWIGDQGYNQGRGIYKINYDDMAFSIDIYAYFSAIDGINYPQYHIGLNKAYSIAESNYNLKNKYAAPILEFAPILGMDTIRYNIDPGDIDRQTLAKFDGPNGFKFRGDNW